MRKCKHSRKIVYILYRGCAANMNGAGACACVCMCIARKMEYRHEGKGTNGGKIVYRGDICVSL